MKKIAKKIMTRFWVNCAANDQKRLALQSPSPNIHEENDIFYKADGHKHHMLDIYWPEDTVGKLPVVFDIHGGGWMYGDKDLNKYYCMKLASKGFAVINISYRLVPEVLLDGQLRDVFRALDFIDKNAANYPVLDMDRFFITGDSAGGQLALLTAAFQQSAELRNRFVVRANNIKVRAAGIVCGFNNFDRINRFPLAKDYCAMVLGNDFKTSELGKIGNFANVICQVDNLPPLWLLSSKEDFIGKQTLALEKLLVTHKQKYKIRVWGKGTEHKLEHVFNVIYPEWNESEVSNNDMLDFFMQQVGEPSQVKA